MVSLPLTDFIVLMRVFSPTPGLVNATTAHTFLLGELFGVTH